MTSMASSSPSTNPITGPGLAAQTGLAPEEFAAAFPFHLILHPDLTLAQVGPSLAQALPSLTVGASFLETFRIVEPKGCAGPAALASDGDGRALLRSRRAVIGRKCLKLRGQFLELGREKVLAFLGTPWGHDIRELLAMGL